MSLARPPRQHTPPDSDVPREGTWSPVRERAWYSASGSAPHYGHDQAMLREHMQEMAVAMLLHLLLLALCSAMLGVSQADVAQPTRRVARCPGRSRSLGQVCFQRTGSGNIRRRCQGRLRCAWGKLRIRSGGFVSVGLCKPRPARPIFNCAPQSVAAVMQVSAASSV